ncbi:hypothetical protein [Kitasatospora sp. NPDC054795]
MDINTWTTVGTSAVAVVGTLSGTLLAGWMNSRTSRAAQALADAKDRRSEVVSSVTALVAALEDHRRAQMIRAKGMARALAATGDVAVADEQYTPAVHQTRSAVSGPNATLRIICPELAEAAEQAVRATFAIRDAANLAEAEPLRLQSKLFCDALVSEASQLLAHSDWPGSVQPVT